jgi:hypothetical protein
MTRFRIVALSTGVALAAGITVAIAGTPFGGDDTGTIPSDSPKGPITKCENGVGKAAGKLLGSFLKCVAHDTVGRVDILNVCPGMGAAKFRNTKTAGCSGCTNIAATIDAVVGFVRATNNQIYCTATGTPFGDVGGIFTGNFPPDAPKGPITKCENRVNKATSKLGAALLKCHASRASGKLADDTAEDNCEAAALATFGATRTIGCDSCTNLAALGAFVENQVDSANSGIYCASPSGAFLQ